MLEHKNIMFLDIETVAQYPDFESAPDDVKAIWTKKMSRANTEGDPGELYERAPLYAEFGKIVCISVGMAYHSGNKLKIKTKSFAGEDEKLLLEDFSKAVNDHTARDFVNNTLCGHNSKTFDFPFIARRMLINGIQIPKCMVMFGKKPWEINLLDTMDMWKFGDFKYYTSLNSLANVFNIPTPKDDIDGSQVNGVYWKDKDIKRISTYCEKDVITTARVCFKLLSMEDISDED